MKFSVRGQLLFKQHCLNFVYVITLFLPNLEFLFVEKNAVFTYNVMILLAWVPHENTRINTKYEHDGWNGTQGDCLTNRCMCRRLSLSSVVKFLFAVQIYFSRQNIFDYIKSYYSDFSRRCRTGEPKRKRSID